MQPQTVLRIIRQYGYDNGDILQAEKGYSNESYPVVLPGGVTINILLYKHEPETINLVRRVRDVSMYLHDK